MLQTCVHMCLDWFWKLLATLCYTWLQDWRTSCTGFQAYTTHSSQTDMKLHVPVQCNNINAGSQPFLLIALLTLYVSLMGGYTECIDGKPI